MSPVPLRKTGDGPFCWQSKAARRKIREAFDATHNAGAALGVYDALTEIASDTGKESFETTHAWIGHVSGLSRRTVQSVVKALSEVGLLEVTSPALRSPCNYRLLPIGNGCATIGNGCATLRNGEITPSLRRSEEKEERSEEREKNPDGGGADAPPAGVQGDLLGDSAPAPTPPRARERNPVIDALAACDGSKPDQVTRSAWKAVAAALKEIRVVCPEVTPEEIARRASNYRAHFKDCAITANALAKHWGRCDAAPVSAKANPNYELEAAAHQYAF